MTRGTFLSRDDEPATELSEDITFFAGVGKQIMPIFRVNHSIPTLPEISRLTWLKIGVLVKFGANSRPARLAHLYYWRADGDPRRFEEKTSMFTVKHLMDAATNEDGERLFVESGGLTKDLVEWCGVDHVLSHFGPPLELVKWFDEHPQGYEYFRGKYHEALANGPHADELQRLVVAGLKKNFVLLHMGDNPSENTATALYEFLSELEAHVEHGSD